MCRLNTYSAKCKSISHNTNSCCPNPPFSHLHLSLSIPSSLHPNQSLPPPSLMHPFMSSPISPLSLPPSLPHPDVPWTFCRPSAFLGGNVIPPPISPRGGPFHSFKQPAWTQWSCRGEGRRRARGGVYWICKTAVKFMLFSHMR